MPQHTPSPSAPGGANRERIADKIAEGERAALQALAHRLATEIDACPYPRFLPMLAKPFITVMVALSKMPAPATTHVDQIAKSARPAGPPPGRTACNTSP
jgi:hypothetical protein